LAGMVHIQDSIILILYTKMNNLFLNTIKQYDMINKGDTVAICLSGGADSMALFHLMCVYREQLGIEIFAIHINHGLRSESDEEENFIRNYCENLGVECITTRFEMSSRQKPQGLSTETWARQLRYEFFDKTAKCRKAKLATAHTLSDKCETVIFNLCRGASLKGSCGIPAVRGNIIRPLINCTREDVENYCSRNNIPYVTDKSNFSEEYSRNKIRLKVVPVLKQLNPKSEQQIGEFTREMEQIYTFLTQLSDTLYRNSISLNGFVLDIVRKADDVVIKLFLRNVLDKYGCLSKENIEDILQGIKDGKFSRQLSKDILCEIKNGYLSFYKPRTTVPQTDVMPVAVEFEKEVQFLGNGYILRRLSVNKLEKMKKIDKNYLNNCINCDTIKCNLFFRTRKTGDTFTFSARRVTKTLKKIFIEDKIPQKIRDRIAVLSDENGNVIWLDGYGVNGPYKAEKNTKNILIIEKM